MILGIILCLLFCPTILFIWMCACNVRTARAAERIVDKIAPKPEPTDSDKNLVTFCAAGIAIIIWLLIIIIGVAK